MNISYFAFIALACVAAVALPVRLALRRGSWRAALAAGVLAVAAPVIAFVYFNYLTNNFEVALIGIVVGVPLSACLTCGALLYAISKLVPPRARGREEK